jgi:hypothetical protein
MLFGWILMLAAVAALQQDCTSTAPGALALAGTAGYLGPVSCSEIYGYTWWITWYVFLMLLVVPILAAKSSLHKFRGGLLGMLALAVMLVSDTANTFNIWNHLGFGKVAKDRARAMIAGSIIVSIALYLLICLIGVADEKGEKVEVSGEPKEGEETYGGRYVPKPGTTPGAPYAVEPTPTM